MSNIEFLTHTTSVIDFLRTLVVKCEALAVNDNALIRSAGYQVSSDKKTWRYYLNMSGVYHETDEPMYIDSIDTGERILFSKRNLEIHLATARACLPGQYWYKRMTEQYPHQIELINGILDPVDIDLAISSPNYRIIRYDKSFLNKNEDQLIPKVQLWVDGFCKRLIENNRYLKIENLYLPYLYGVMYLFLIPTIITIRLEACGTRNVSDYYIWSKLNSHGDFSNFKKVITHGQKMWLYRNIEWVNQTTGQNHTLNKLVENLLTTVNVPLDRYDAVINTTNILEKGVGTVGYSKDPMNFKENFTPTSSIVSVHEMALKESTQAIDNTKDINFLESEVQEKLTYNLHSVSNTKILDSSMEDRTNRHSETLMKTLFHEWIYLVKNNKYPALLELTHPQTGETFKLNMKDSLVLWQYLTSRLRGENVTYIQPFFYQSVIKIEPPTIETLKAAGGDEYLPLSMCEEIRKLWIATPLIVSPDALFDFSFEVYKLNWTCKKVYSQFMDIFKYSRTREATNRLFERGMCFLHDRKEEVYADWLLNRGLMLKAFSDDDLIMLSWEIFCKGTAWDIKASASLRKLQKSSMELMKMLSSYTVQYLYEINDGNDIIENNQRSSYQLSKETKMSNDTSELYYLLRFDNQAYFHPRSYMNNIMRYDNETEKDNKLKGDITLLHQIRDTSMFRPVSTGFSSKIITYHNETVLKEVQQ